MTPTGMMSLLSVPGSDDALHYVITQTASGQPYQGWMEDARGAVVGRLRDFRFHFVGFAPVTTQERAARRFAPVEAAPTPVCDFIAPTSERLACSGAWFDLAGFLRGTNGDDPAAVMVLHSAAPRIELQLHAHPWSGICEIEVDGESRGRCDLFNPATAVPRRVAIDNPTGARRKIAVRATGLANPCAFGRQLLVEGVHEYGAQTAVPAFAKSPARNRGGAFSPRFLEIVAGLPADAVILDIGGGKRQLDDPRYINLEYAAYEEPDMFGDALALPFKTGSIDFVYTAAVLEHVSDPLRAGAEIHRVLKPGGHLLANSAFMQPVHSEGQHFFNATPYGIARIFAAFPAPKITWDGSLSDLMKWCLSVTGVTRLAAADDLAAFQRLAEGFDRVITYDKLMYIASGVWLEARR